MPLKGRCMKCSKEVDTTHHPDAKMGGTWQHELCYPCLLKYEECFLASDAFQAKSEAEAVELHQLMSSWGKRLGGTAPPFSEVWEGVRMKANADHLCNLFFSQWLEKEND